MIAILKQITNDQSFRTQEMPTKATKRNPDDRKV